MTDKNENFITEEQKNLLTRHQYKIIGKNAGVKICLWTKRSLTDNGVCYKEKFYGIKSHRCIQMSPSLMNCTYSCTFCWRLHELSPKISDGIFDEPEEIVEKSIIAQRVLLSGFKGNKNINIKKFEEAQNPNQVAISLVGEPLLYPKIYNLIEAYKRRNFTTFVVSNGSVPKKNAEIKPTQLYISMNAPDEEIFKKICRPSIKDAWKIYNESLEFFSKKSDVKRVIRLTMIKDFNSHNIEGYAKLIEKANPDFIECKSFMFVGGSRHEPGLSLDKMLTMKEILEFSEKLEKVTGYKIKDYKEESRVALLTR
ncbi:MAG: 4-demethylwyosine synthase TYW1 [Candidatus Altarchaeum sp.]|nr:4-demethylwyosine synthase TYW1 [Candidatus Altarchaeum sp.]